MFRADSAVFLPVFTVVAALLVSQSGIPVSAAAPPPPPPGNGYPGFQEQVIRS